MHSQISPLLLPLAVSFLALACNHGQTAKTSEPPPDPPQVAEIVEWLVGEQVRAPTTKNRSVGLVILDIDAKALGSGTLQPGSCAPGLTSVILIPRTTDQWLGVDGTETLYRYSRTGWAAVPSKIALPPLAKLIAIGPADGENVHVLVYKQGDNEQLWQLTLSPEAVTGIRGVDRTSFSTRRATLEAYDSGRCLGIRDCLHLTSIGKDVILSREPEIYDNWVTKIDLGATGARDVRYAGAAGKGGKKKMGLLIAAPCEPPAEPGDPAPEATPSPSALVGPAAPSSTTQPKRSP